MVAKRKELNNFSRDRVRVQKYQPLLTIFRTALYVWPRVYLPQNYLRCYDKGPMESQFLGKVTGFCTPAGSYIYSAHEYVKATLELRVAQRVGWILCRQTQLTLNFSLTS